MTTTNYKRITSELTLYMYIETSHYKAASLLWILHYHTSRI